MIVLRLLLRLLIVPLGAMVATFVAVAVVSLAQWNRFAAMVVADKTTDDGAILALILVGSALTLILAFAALTMLLPASLGVLIAEAFAIRSWMFHAANGGVAAWVGWVTMEEFRRNYEFFDQPIVVVGAGIAAGFAYWAVAGWSAGFWKPVFAQPVDAVGPPQTPTKSGTFA